MGDKMRRVLLFMCAMLVVAATISGMAVSVEAVTYDYSSVITDDGNWRVWIKKATSTTAAECAIKPAKSNVAGVSKGAVVIPASITYKKTKYAVTNIVSSAWQGNKTITSVNFKNSTKLVSIRQNAFKGCENLTYLYYFSSVPLAAVGDSAFEGDDALTGNSSTSGLVFPKTIKTIGKNAFKGIGTTEIYLSTASALTTVGDGAFTGLFDEVGEEYIYVYNSSKVNLLKGKTNIGIRAVNCTINYRSNDGKNTTKTQNASINSSSITLSASNTFTRTGYSFGSWNMKTDGKGTRYSGGAKISGDALPDSGVLNLYAVWTPIVYTVKFDKNAPVNVNTNQAYSVTGTMANLSCKYDQTVSLPANKFACAGFTMAGWYTNKNGTGSKVTSIKNMRNTAGDVILYAKWTPISYKVKYNANGGTGSMAVQNMNYNTKYTLTVNAFTRTGYKCTGWAVSAAGAKKFNDAATVSNLTTTAGAEYNLYAVWQPIKYSVNFRKPSILYVDEEKKELVDEFSGSVTNIYNAEYGKRYAVSASHYDAEGYEFKGWLYNGSPVTDIYNLTTTDGTYLNIYEDMRPITYTVKFDRNGGRVRAGSSDYSDACMTYSKSYRGYDGSVYENPGYTFAGWSTSPDGKVEYLAGDRLINITNKPEAVTLYAVWTPLKYTIRFNANVADTSLISGSQADLVCTYGKPYRLGLCDINYPGYKLASWNTVADGSGTAYEENALIQDLTDKEEIIDLYAQWEPITYVLKFSANTGSGTPHENMTITYGKAWTIPEHKEDELYKTGYRFAGWCTNRRGVKDPAVDKLFEEDQTYTENLTTTEDEEITLYAIWKPAKYRVRLVTGTDEKIADKEFAYNSSGVALEEADAGKKPGYEFSSWNTMEDGSGIQLDDSLSPASNKNVLDAAVTDENDEYTCIITLYAQWAPLPYIVSMIPDTKEGAAELPDDLMEIEVLYGSRYADKLPTPVLEHYDFLYWAKADGTPITADTVYDDPLVAGIEIHPVWKIKEYTVVYNYMGAADSATDKTVIRKKYKYGAKLSDLPGASDVTLSASQSAEYKEFFYWALDKRGAQQIGRSYTVSGDVTLYAYIAVRSYNVTFDFNGGRQGNQSKKTLTYNGGTALRTNQEYSKLSSQVQRSGYTFEGWYDTRAGQNNVVGDSYVVSGDMTLYALWNKVKNNNNNPVVTPKTYKVTFNYNGATYGRKGKADITYSEADKLESADLFNKVSQKIRRPGYRFGYWYYKEGSKEVKVTGKYAVTAQRTFYIKWIRVYKVRYSLGGGTYGGKKAYSAVYDSNTALKSNELFGKLSKKAARKGYVFDGWYYKADKKTINVKSTTKVKKAVTLIAKWRKPDITKKASVLKKSKKQVAVSWKNDAAFTSFQYRYAKNTRGLKRAKVFKQGMIVKTVRGRKTKVLPNSINVGYKNPYIIIQVRGVYRDSMGRVRKTAWKTFYDVDNVRKTVTFDAKGGRIVIGKKKVKTTKAAYVANQALRTSPAFLDGKLYTPVRKGYRFAGWYYKKGKREVKVTIASKLAPGTKVYAKWKR